MGQFPSPSKIVFRENVSTFCNIDGEFFELHKPKSIKFTKVYTVKVVCPSDPGKSRLLRDEGIIPGAPNAYVLPVDIVV